MKKRSLMLVLLIAVSLMGCNAEKDKSTQSLKDDANKLLTPSTQKEVQQKTDTKPQDDTGMSLADKIVEKDADKEEKKPYDSFKVNPGDVISGMTVKSVTFDKTKDLKPGDTMDYSIAFMGEFEAEGSINISEMTGEYLFESEDLVKDKLPYSTFDTHMEEVQGMKLKVHFSIANEKDLVKVIQEKIPGFKYGDSATIKAKFSNYSFVVWGLEAGRFATFTTLFEVK